MSTTATPRIGAPYLVEGQGSPEVTVNAGLFRLDMVVQAAVIDRDLTAPPGAPDEGHAYLVAAGATGAWSGHDDQISEWDGSAWQFVEPWLGFLIYVADEGALIVNGPGGWEGIAGAIATTIADVAGLQDALDAKMDASAASGFATAAQGALADSALQADDLSPYATTAFVESGLAEKVDDSQASAAGLAVLGAANAAKQRSLISTVKRAAPNIPARGYATATAWTIRTSAADNNWRAIAWSPELGLFAAVADTGTGNRVMTSPDGVTWTIRTSAADNNWAAIAWSPELGLFAAVAYTGTGNRVMTSPDGVTWTIRTSAADNNWAAIAWSPELGLFAAVAPSGTGNRVMTNGAYPGNPDYRRRSPRSAALADADATLAVGVNAVFQTLSATLMLNRTITLSAAYAISGDTFSIKRSGLGAFTLAIVNGGPAGGTLRTGASATASAGVYVFDGTNWAEQSYVLL
jgi:hypothetical protein